MVLELTPLSKDELPFVKKTRKPRVVKSVQPVEPVEVPKLKPLAAQTYTTYEDFPIEDLMVYAGIDCLVTSNLLSKLWPIVNEEPAFTYFDGTSGQIKKYVGKAMSIEESYSSYTLLAHEFIIDMELNGIKYDIELNAAVKADMEGKLAELEESIFNELGKKVDLNSGDALRDLLYVEKDLEIASYTKTNQPSTDGEALSALAEKYGFQWLKNIALRNDINSLYNTFVKNYVEDFVKRDGRIHPSYNLQGTSSFRITGSDPNLTQLPRAKHGYNLRQAFIVDDGYLFLALDFSSAEVKVLGALCKDPALLKAIEEGKDFHSFSAANMYGIDYDEFVKVLSDKKHPNFKDYKEKRQYAKALTFGILYGSSPNGIAANLNVSLEQAKELINMYFNLFPRIKTYVESAHNMATTNYMVVSPFGQRKMEYGAREVFKGTAVYNGALRNSQNVLVQNTSSSLGLFCFSHLNQALKKLGGRSLCTVYDSIELEIPIEKAAEALELAFYYMNDFPLEKFHWLTLPIGVEAEIGYNWGEASVVHRGATQEEIMELVGTR